MTTERILDRVRKLLNLANDDAASEGERDNALRMAHNLLTKHELSMADVDAHTRERDDPRGSFDHEGWNMPWCRNVRAAVARLFMCKYLYTRINATRGKHYFVGRESNATTAMYLADWIVKGLLREADKRYGHRLTKEGRSFGEGAATRLSQRVTELLRVAQADVASTGSALVLADLAKTEADANDAFVAANIGKTKAGVARSTRVDSSAYGAGKAHADGIQLNRQVGGSRPDVKRIA